MGKSVKMLYAITCSIILQQKLDQPVQTEKKKKKNNNKKTKKKKQVKSRTLNT